jgi:hypothetical protein
VEENFRALLIQGAGSAGGKALNTLWRMLEQERDELNGKRERRVEDDGSEIPRSQADFEKMLKDEG